MLNMQKAYDMHKKIDSNRDNYLELLHTAMHLPPCARSVTSYSTEPGDLDLCIHPVPWPMSYGPPQGDHKRNWLHHHSGKGLDIHLILWWIPSAIQVEPLNEKQGNADELMGRIKHRVQRMCPVVLRTTSLKKNWCTSLLLQHVHCDRKLVQVASVYQEDE